MSALGLDEDEMKNLEQMLSRLAQLTSSIQSLRQDVMRSNPLPPTASLQASAQILQRNLQSVLDSLADNQDLFSRLAIHPSTNFPGRTHENVLIQLLRKKLDPAVEENVEKGREMAETVGEEGLAKIQDVWNDARSWTQQRIAQYVSEEAGDPYTKEEREMGIENVRTGLRRDLEDDEDEDEDDEDEDGEEGAKSAPASQQGDQAQAAPPVRGPELETILWFMTRGDFDVPSNIQFERKTGQVYRGLQGVNVPPDELVGQAMEGVDQS